MCSLETQSQLCVRDCSHLGGGEGSGKGLLDPQNVDSAAVNFGLERVKLAPIRMYGVYQNP